MALRILLCRSIPKVYIQFLSGKIMRPILISFIISLILTSSIAARDFRVDFVEENYKETQTAYSKFPKIYHSIQVRSQAGPKLLVLTGENLEYRRWLRQFIAQDKSFMVKLADNETDNFIGSRVYEVEITRVHPFNGEKWEPPGKSQSEGQLDDIPILHGDRHIMVVDQNLKRRELISSVIKRMGYTPTISKNGEQALSLFKSQPEKFKMIITNHDLQGMAADHLIGNLLKIDHQIPILVETGYKNTKTRELFRSKFSGAGTVTVKPVALDNLQNTIKQLVKG